MKRMATMRANDRLGIDHVESVFSFSQALSLSSAFPRWEILFFSSLGISA